MITFVIPTICRSSLMRTLDSIECWPGDEILMISDMSLNLHCQSFIMNRKEIRCVHSEQGYDWGHKERNSAANLAKGRYVAHIDDDDIYASGTRVLMADAIERTPNRPVLFRMQFPNGITLWNEPIIRCGNVGTPMMLLPNEPKKFGTWGSFVGGDCHFLETSQWGFEDFVWRPEIIALLGHNT